MYENTKVIIIPKDNNVFLNGLVIEFNNNTLIAECRIPNAILLNQKALIFLYNTVKGEIEYEGEITSITKYIVVLQNLIFIKNTQRRNETRVNLDLTLQVKKIIVGDSQNIDLPKILLVQTIDLSASGISILCKLNIREHVKIPIELPIDIETIQCIAEIIRKEKMDNGFYRYGCKFIGLTERIQDRIRGYVYKRQVENRKN